LKIIIPLPAWLLFVFSGLALAGAPSRYEVAFSTYLGGTNFDAIRDVAVDHQGNIVVVGGRLRRIFPSLRALIRASFHLPGRLAAGWEPPTFSSRSSAPKGS